MDSWFDEERNGEGVICPVDPAISGVEAVRLWAGAGDMEDPLAVRRVGKTLPETVCLRFRGDGVRATLPCCEGNFLLSVPRTSLRDTFGPVDATCHGDATL